VTILPEAAKQVLPPVRSRRTGLQGVGDFLRDHQALIRHLQWGLVCLYGLLLLVPVLPAPLSFLGYELLSHNQVEVLGRFARILFWCVWWPGVILSVMIFGQFWCGLLCPDGAVTEFASRHGRALKIPARLRWAGWPLLLFTGMTLLEAVIDIRGESFNALWVLGSISCAALLVGLLYGKGKRVWCRYLCPTAGLFSLLARCAVLHFKVDREAWDSSPRPARAVDCPPMLDVRRLRSNEKCSMCGRCSGHRNAVALAVRPMGSELSRIADGDARPLDVVVILWLLFGLTLSVAQGEQGFASNWLAGHGLVSLWVLTHLGLPSIYALVFGGLLLIAANGHRQVALRLTYALIPLGGMFLILMAAQQGWQSLGIENTTPWPWRMEATLSMLGLAWSWRIVLDMASAWQPRLVLGLLLGLAVLLRLMA